MPPKPLHWLGFDSRKTLNRGRGREGVGVTERFYEPTATTTLLYFVRLVS